MIFYLQSYLKDSFINTYKIVTKIIFLLNFIKLNCVHKLVSISKGTARIIVFSIFSGKLSIINKFH